MHQNLVAGVIENLEMIFGKGYYADKVIEKQLRANRKWGSRDRSFVASNTYDMVRWWRLLWTIYGKEPNLKRKELYNLFGIWWMYKGGNLPQWPKFENVQNFDVEYEMRNVPDSIAVRESFPDWLAERLEAELGDKWPKIAAASNQPAEWVIRTNTLVTTRERLINRLAEENVPSTPLKYNDVGLLIERRVNAFRLQSFQDGWFEVQDGGSQRIAPFLGAQPGQRVIDACAGAGGKTLHIAAEMQNKGSIIAMDVEGWKLSELKKRARRNGVHNVETREIEGSKTIKRLQNSADCLLLDVPCSGTGVFKRNPDAKWKLQPEHIERTLVTQKEILKNYTEMLKPGGTLVYATCSLLHSENEDQVATFLAATGDEYKLIDEIRLYPTEPTSDGFYMAKMVKKG